ncbi:UxaA family hydrolase [Alphaproteobacteria bacterium]|jgi:altronate dehydratase large subunit|nr:UxaA family hydrolase [Alphaproteobacteria bacterium]
MSTIANNHELFGYAQSLRWHGYQRADGRIGIRNHLIVLSTVALTDWLASSIAASDPDVICVSGGFSRGLQKTDEDVVVRFIKSVLSHPNVGSALVITHDASSSELIEKEVQTSIPIEYLAFMRSNGRKQALTDGIEKIQFLADQQRKLKQERIEVNLSSLSMALECGGSDVSSSICANPIIGDITDLIVSNGGSAIVSETSEFIGAETIFGDRCPSPETRQSILDFIDYRSGLIMKDSGKDYRGTNPTKENIDGGLTTLIEKSMGAVSKTGTMNFASALDFGMSPIGQGLHFMDTPFFSPVSLTGMMMAGCNLGLFAMGLFNPTGNPLCPTIKICGNPKTLRDWRDDIDVGLDNYFTGEIDRCAAQKTTLSKVNEVFNGTQTASEALREGQFILPRLKDAL